MDKPEEAKKRIDTLTVEISRHNRLYHQESTQKINDPDYDRLKRELKALETRFPAFKRADSPSDLVGAPPQKGFMKARHRLSMLSLDNAFSADAALDFFDKARRFLTLDDALGWSGELKIDGVSISLIYKEGHLVHALSRGDGEVGEYLTAQVKTIPAIPHQLSQTERPIPDIVEIRGEVYMHKADLKTLNEAQKDKEGKIFVNPRNAVSGSLRQLDSAITASRPLRFFAHGWGYISQENLFETNRQATGWIKDIGFPLIPERVYSTDPDRLINFYHHIAKQRHNLDYEIDGIVYKVDNLAYRERLGNLRHAPRWAVAMKFKAEQQKTLIQDIVVQVGRSGVLTPVAVLSPVTVGGVTVERATLHNEDEIIRKDIRKNDTAIVQRAGDVIPQIIDIDSDLRPQNSQIFVFPKNCPSCGADIIRKKGEAAHYCTNKRHCPAQQLERLKHFCSRKAFDIRGLSERNLAFFIHKNMITDAADIFALKQHAKEIESFKGWKKLSVENLLDAIEDSQHISLERFIYAQGIPHIGQETAYILARHYQTVENFIHSVVQADHIITLANIDSIGEGAAHALGNFFNQENNISLVKKLLGATHPQNFEDAAFKDGLLTGKNVVFTGKLEKTSRAEAKSQAKKLGAHIASDVSKNTTYLIAGEKPGSKFTKASKLGVIILDEDQWHDLISYQKESF